MSDTAITVICNNYDASSEDADQETVAPISYFVVGASRGEEDDPPTALRGDDLVSGVKFKDDLRASVNDTKSLHRWNGETKTSGNTASTLTDELLSRGGYRDHTDGNRISTTRGDQIDVVYGNYTLIVKGRIDNDAANGALSECYLDMSGGHINEGTSTGGTVISSEWSSSSQDGSWKTVEQTDDGDKKVVHTGYYESAYHGETRGLSIGKGCDATTIDNGSTSLSKHDADKPDITRETYARSIDHREKIGASTWSHTISGSFKDHTTVHSSFRRAYGTTYQRWYATCAFKEELLVDTLQQDHDYRFQTIYEAGVAKCDIRTIGVHHTTEDGSHYTMWPYGIDVRATTPLSAKILVGLDTYYRSAPSVDFIVAKTLKLNLTLDVVAALNRGALALVKRGKKLLGMRVNPGVDNENAAFAGDL